MDTRPLPAHLTPAERVSLDAFRQQARAMLAEDLEEMRLFGSRARGEGHAGSDVDVVLIVSTRGHARRREVHDLAFDLGLLYGVWLAPTVIPRERLDHLRSRERLFARELDRDGIPL